jgi:cysteine desulfurase
MAVYLDHNASSPLLQEVAEPIRRTMLELFGNPSSIHSLGVAAETVLEDSRRTVARLLGVDPGEIVFTSGGTESNNLAVLGTARALVRRGKRLVVSAAEHEAVLEPARALEQEGFTLDVAPLDEAGGVDLDRLAGLLRPDTVLVACILASNETGTIQPVEAVAALVRERAPVASLHVDAVQAFGKIPVRPPALGSVTLSGTGHKIGGPRGAGLLYVRKGAPIRPISFGGGQERGLRPGTQDVAAIVGLAHALRLAVERQGELQTRWRALRTRLLDGLSERFPVHASGGSLRVNTPLDRSVTSTLNLSFPGMRGEVLVRALERHGVVCSTGPACHERTGRKGSRMLGAMGLSASEQQGAVRISMGPETSPADIDVALASFEAALSELSWTMPGRARAARRRSK